MPSGLIALLDDVATIAKLAASSLDDVAGAAGKAGTKAAGVVIDDTAVTPRYVVGLAPERLRDYPHQFSGGMRQRTAIAMALALRPKLIVADEPVTALDVLIQKQILDLLMELRASLGLSLIIITHDIGVVSQACDRVVVMYGGQVVEEGRVDDVLLHPAHPYTMGLLQAFPDLADGPRDLVPIPGIPPDLAHPPEGCRFAPRCLAQIPESLEKLPQLVEAERNHFSACVRAFEMARVGAEGLGLARASLAQPSAKTVDRSAPLMRVRGLKTHFEVATGLKALSASRTVVRAVDMLVKHAALEGYKGAALYAEAVLIALYNLMDPEL
jgi:oligopeptide/dipeptide ABC transporter ATP-binding protein